MSSNEKRDKAIIIVAAIIEKNGKLLMIQEGREDVRGKWNVPAGHVDFGEDPITAVVRETKEETGLDVKPKSLAGIYVFKDKGTSLTALRIHFNCEILGGKFEDQEGEILDIRWMSKKELQAFNSGGKLRSEKTWLSVQDWLKGRSFPLDIIKVIPKII